jgi:hypothetical protein
MKESPCIPGSYCQLSNRGTCHVTALDFCKDWRVEGIRPRVACGRVSVLCLCSPMGNWGVFADPGFGLNAGLVRGAQEGELCGVGSGTSDDPFVICDPTKPALFCEDGFPSRCRSYSLLGQNCSSTSVPPVLCYQDHRTPVGPVVLGGSGNCQAYFSHAVGQSCTRTEHCNPGLYCDNRPGNYVCRAPTTPSRTSDLCFTSVPGVSECERWENCVCQGYGSFGGRCLSKVYTFCAEEFTNWLGCGGPQSTEAPNQCQEAWNCLDRCLYAEHYNRVKFLRGQSHCNSSIPEPCTCTECGNFASLLSISWLLTFLTVGWLIFVQ